MFEICIEHIQTEAIHAAIQPEAKSFQLRLSDGRVAPVDIRLFFGEQVQVILAGGGIEFPGFPAKGGRPVVGSVFPDVPIPFRVVPA